MHIERQDAARVALAFFLLMLVVGSYTVVKSVRDAVFLSRFGVTELSLLSIGLAAAMSLIVGLYLRLTSNISHNTLLIGTYGIVAASLGGIAFGLGSQKLSSFMPWVLYVWSSIFGVFTIMQFWLLASGLFDPRGAKRFFGTIGSGAIVGGMGGGLLSRLLAVHLSPGALLWVAGSMLIMAAALAKIVWPMRQRERLRKRGPKMPEKGGGPSALRESPYLRLIAMSVLMATIVATLLDWQFKGIVKVEFAGRTDEMVRFFGGLYGYISLTALVLQISVTGWVLRRFGLIFGLFFLPVSLFIGSSGILFSAMLPISGLMAASIAKVADGGVRFAIGKVSMELLWLPVGRRLKERGKAFVDTVIDRVGTGVTGLIWLVLAFLGLTSPGRLHLISALSMIFVLGWMVVVYRTRKAYVVALRKTIEDRNLRLDDLRSNVVDLQTNNSIAELLGSGEGAKVHFALYLLANVSHTLPDLATLLIGKDTSLKMAAWRLVGMKEDRRYRKLAVQTLLDDTFETRRVVLGYLRVTSKIASGKCLSEASSDDAMVSLALNVARLSVPKVEARAAEAFRAFIASKGEDDAIVAIDLLSEAPPRAAAALLLPLLREDRRGRRRAAIRSAGRSKAIETLAPLLSLLDDHHWRPWVKTALMDMGSSVAEALVGVLSDANARPKAAEATATLLDILGASPSPSAAAILMAYCDKDQDKRISSAALGGLVRLRKEYRYDTERATVFEILGQEVSELAQNLLALDSGS
ncbi:MAG: hypothetical protein KAI47_13325, partial [Deltaproteobacteria bacterium]|nr:hypothetical protein [Deltaproteobacteria bacterium]